MQNACHSPKIYPTGNLRKIWDIALIKELSLIILYQKKGKSVNVKRRVIIRVDRLIILRFSELISPNLLLKNDTILI